MDGSALPPQWRDAVRDDPTAATATRQQVIAGLQGRADPIALRECLATDAIAGTLVLRFTVDVESGDEQVRIGDAHFVEALEGPPISDEASTCIEHQLAGEDVAPQPGGLQGYVGPVDYRLTIHVPASG
jgi:hypothetical protein